MFKFQSQAVKSGFRMFTVVLKFDRRLESGNGETFVKFQREIILTHISVDTYGKPSYHSVNIGFEDTKILNCR